MKWGTNDTLDFNSLSFFFFLCISSRLTNLNMCPPRTDLVLFMIPVITNQTENNNDKNKAKRPFTNFMIPNIVNFHFQNLVFQIYLVTKERKPFLGTAVPCSHFVDRRMSFLLKYLQSTCMCQTQILSIMIGTGNSN